MEKDRKKNLDEISIDKSIVLRAYDGHTMFLNSKAFKEIIIDIDTLCPIGVKIEINEETNELWGTLKESAIHLIKEHNYFEEDKLKMRISNSMIIFSMELMLFLEKMK